MGRDLTSPQNKTTTNQKTPTGREFFSKGRTDLTSPDPKLYSPLQTKPKQNYNQPKTPTRGKKNQTLTTKQNQPTTRVVDKKLKRDLGTKPKTKPKTKTPTKPKNYQNQNQKRKPKTRTNVFYFSQVRLTLSSYYADKLFLLLLLLSLFVKTPRPGTSRRFRFGS